MYLSSYWYNGKCHGFCLRLCCHAFGAPTFPPYYRVKNFRQSYFGATLKNPDFYFRLNGVVFTLFFPDFPLFSVCVVGGWTFVENFFRLSLFESRKVPH